uniref:Uncharacterized protein n=3 Tax=Zea mays TaxID=4577 RepID=A0A804PPE3_MAIZE
MAAWAFCGWEERSLKISAVGVVLEVDVNGEELFFVDKFTSARPAHCHLQRKTQAASTRSCTKILDEMMDNGFPLTTEPNILKEMITPPNIVNKMLNVVTGKSSTLGSKLPDAAASFVPWRRTTVKDASNEVYVNIVEELDAYVNREGQKGGLDKHKASPRVPYGLNILCSHLFRKPEALLLDQD